MAAVEIVFMLFRMQDDKFDLNFPFIFTVRDHQANSHAKKGWEMFTDAAIRAISQKRTGVVFLLWANLHRTRSGSYSFLPLHNMQVVFVVKVEQVSEGHE